MKLTRRGKKKNPRFFLIISRIIPFKGQTSNWRERERERKRGILDLQRAERGRRRRGGGGGGR